jgi:nicotinamide-nucleotide amidase
MKAALLNTGTELLLGDVQDLHLSFIAREILPLGLRIEEQRIVPDGPAIRETLADLLPRADIVFVTGGLGPTTDDMTREIVAELLGLELDLDEKVMATITERLRKRGIRATDRISRQAFVPRGAQVLPNQNGTAPGLYLWAGINPHLFLLPGPPRELQPMFRESVRPILRQLVQGAAPIARRLYKIANTGESIIEEAIGESILAIPGIELGYCARPGEVEIRIIGEPVAIEQADAIIQAKLGSSIFSADDQTLEEVIVQLLRERKETMAVAESCTGGLLAHRITNVPGASEVFLAGYIAYSNAAKIDLLAVDPKLIERYGAVSEEVAGAMAEGARNRAKSNHALATTGIAGPSGGSAEKPVGTLFLALASEDAGTTVRKLFFPSDRETFKQIAGQVAFDLLRQKLI